MKLLGIPAGPKIGAAYDFLLELRLEHGPLGQERAEAELRKWWNENQN
jgi:poly(A) polymerase